MFKFSMSVTNSNLSNEISSFVNTFTAANLYYIAKYIEKLNFIILFIYREKGSFVDQSKDIIGGTVFVMKYLLAEIVELGKKCNYI